KYARIFVSVMGTPEEQKATMDALFSSRGYVRRELASRMSIRAVPEIQFKLDHGVEYSDRINRLLNELKEDDAKKVSDTIVASDDGASDAPNDIEEESATPPQEETR
ncbi:MAG TPA: 30S ribosome-binding factor RbfA, partial [Chloroflexia bacterium]|nr:30S ribosome-binding factor RbfA [Chloroflexia bacterium]